MQLITCFGESQTDPLDKWQQDDTGRRTRITEQRIDQLWWKWVVTPGVFRADTDQYTVFVFWNPINI